MTGHIFTAVPEYLNRVVLTSKEVLGYPTCGQIFGNSQGNCSVLGGHNAPGPSMFMLTEFWQSTYFILMHKLFITVNAQTL